MIWEAAHRMAVERGQDRYIDPASGYVVFTELFHLARGRCCGSACRHCPFGHERVDAPRRAAVSPPTVLRPGSRDEPG